MTIHHVDEATLHVALDDIERISRTLYPAGVCCSQSDYMRLRTPGTPSVRCLERKLQTPWPHIARELGLQVLDRNYYLSQAKLRLVPQSDSRHVRIRDDEELCTDLPMLAIFVPLQSVQVRIEGGAVHVRYEEVTKLR